MKMSNFFEPMDDVRNNAEDFAIFFFIDKACSVFFVRRNQTQTISTGRINFHRVICADSRHDNIARVWLKPAIDNQPIAVKNFGFHRIAVGVS